MNLKQLLNGVPAVLTGGNPAITAVTDRIDEITPGAAFVCVEGKRTDGHTLAQEALVRGAAAVVCERNLGLPVQAVVPDTRAALAWMVAASCGRPAESLRLVGVTGTNGKTTVAGWIRQLLTAAGYRCGLIGTLGADDGETQQATGMTTPECRVLNEQFRQMAQAGCTFAVSEVSSQALSQSRTAGLHFELAVFTNLSAEHLDYHGSMEDYAAAKAKLFAACSTAILNADDPAVSVMAQNAAGRVVTYSLQNDADYTAKNIACKEGSVSYIVVHGEKLARVQVASPGVFSVYNSMAAIAACVAAGVPFEDCCAAVSGLTGAPGRMQRILPEAPFSVWVDYAHTPVALEAALRALRETTAGRLLVLFGCGGDRDREKRPKMGEIAASLAAVTVLTSDNPRSEDPQAILDAIAGGFAGRKASLHIEPERAKAIEWILREAQPGDCVLLAGKGHETVQWLADGAHPFDDVLTAQTVYNSIGY